MSLKSDFNIEARKSNWHLSWFKTSSLVHIQNNLNNFTKRGANYIPNGGRKDIQNLANAINNFKSDNATKAQKYEAALNWLYSKVPELEDAVLGARLNRLISAKAQARENRVVIKRNKQLRYAMSGSTNYNFELALKYNLRTTGIGRQDWEVLVSMPIKVYQGASAKTFWSTKYDPDLFDITTHGRQRLVQGDSADSNVIKKWTNNINDWWGKAAVIHHPSNGRETYYRLKFEFVFTDDASKACAEICAVRTTGQAATTNPSGTIDALRWGVNDTGPGGGICHEVGHFIGNPDEYFTITYEGRTINWGQGYRTDKQLGVMNNPNQRPQARHYRNMGQELANHFNFNPAEASIILDTTLGIDNPNQRRHRLSGHIWDGF